MTPTPPVVLVFTANDPSGGAGVVADVLTLSSLGCHVLPVITAITVQDTNGVQEFQAIDAEQIDEQARFILEDIRIDAIKVGMVGSVENLAVIAEIASDYPEVPLVLDAQLMVQHQDDLDSEEIAGAMRDLLIPHSTIITPDVRSARMLASDDPDEQSDLPLDVAAQRLLALGCEYVLITGSQDSSSKTGNTLYSSNGRMRNDSWARLPGRFHGAGTTLSAALVGALANGADMNTAVQEAQEYTQQTLANAYRPGMGLLVPDRLFWARPAEEGDTAAATPQ
ncbi:bifunctional hydroxymethylpyrimidine kinase/phosphomethylpyrimidine kinase [Chitinilyticum piscinae]|uniref:hydroxymethylpyrimidine kinase n=1 Tax=Chitinilyticum piscinae TaxID=2866724 RepID=A0A8J7FL09_9NEIS|nr:hydroxymethylpyrimidine/phosphomethylpyrimidine kinase [Chitinilyticum piscinae]MBE9608131.1 hydroxymethylpyrimidine/phosphomethylpyrimidine kinase [Chitinilyticum piscinae]